MRSSHHVVSLAAFALSTFAASTAFAVGKDEASADGKGIVGGALLGAELVLTVQAAADVEPAWWYFVGGGAGAIAGGVGGYFIEQEASPRVSMLMLAGGLVLAIPTTVAVLSATAYEPPADYLQDTAPADEPVADPPRPDGASSAPPASAPAPSGRRELRRNKAVSERRFDLTPPALLDIDPNRVAIAIPAVEVRDVFTPAERFVFGVKQVTEVRVPVLAVAF
jgi:hypothetical protein